MTFKEFIAVRPARANAEGDFVRLARANRKMSDAASWSELRSQLEADGAWLNLVEPAQRVWGEYQKETKKMSSAPKTRSA
jgi:hypothetical protein